MKLRARDRTITFPRRPLVMGIVNINDDSFSGDGTLDIDEALAQAGAMLAQGADIIDVGAESARTNRDAIPEEEELARLRPFVRRFPDLVSAFSAAPFDEEQLWPPLLSLNTWRSKVVAAILPEGGDILNDISALPDATNAALCAEHGAALLVMHSVGAPKQPHLEKRYPDILGELDAFFAEKIALAEGAGLAAESLILDPGIDFAKQREDNLRLVAGLARLERFARPLLLPVSRKTVVGEVLGIEEPVDRDAGTIGLLASGFLRGAAIFRVHNVRAAAQAIKVLAATRSARATP